MLQKETLVGLAWAVALVLAMMGVFAYGLAAYEPERFDVRWTASQGSTDSQTGTLVVDDTDDHTFLVPGHNVTEVRVELTWTDRVGEGDDVFELRVQPPEGFETKTTKGSGDSLTVTYAVAAIPDIATAEGANEPHALETMQRPADPWEGDATWTAEVKLVESPDVQDELGLGTEQDGRNGYDIVVVYVTHDATLVPI